MNYREVNQKIEALKNALICASLFAMLFSSCSSAKKTSLVLTKVASLEAVVEEVSENVCCPIPER